MCCYIFNKLRWTHFFFLLYTTQDWQSLSVHIIIMMRGRRNNKISKSKSTVTESVQFWIDHQIWLESKGYILRQSFRAEQDAPVTMRRSGIPKDSPLTLNTHVIMDATRFSDGEVVVLKKTKPSVFPFELQIIQYFSTEPQQSHPHNHCVPLYDVLYPPDDNDMILLVMPLLRSFDSPRFETVGEAVECIRQLFEGLQFMHELHTAHRDISILNVMLDPKPLYPQMFHPALIDRDVNLSGSAKFYTRTARPVKYYFIDFGLLRMYDPADGEPLEVPIFGGDKTVPEFNVNPYDPLNPFPTDVYYLGNFIRRMIARGSVSNGFGFLTPLITRMIQNDPSQRPTIDEATAEFNEVLKSLSRKQLQKQFVDAFEYRSDAIFRAVVHRFRWLFNLIISRDPLPTTHYYLPLDRTSILLSSHTRATFPAT
ncbi:hypothetical protein ABKN59_007335 [Abortiporus biennis]